MARHFRIDDLLSDEHHQEASSLAVKRSTTVDQLWAWLRQRGYKVSRGAVHNWMRSAKQAASDPSAKLRSELHAKIETLTADQVVALLDAVAALPVA